MLLICYQPLSQVTLSITDTINSPPELTGISRYPQRDRHPPVRFDPSSA